MYNHGTVSNSSYQEIGFFFIEKYVEIGNIHSNNILVNLKLFNSCVKFNVCFNSTTNPACKLTSNLHRRHGISLLAQRKSVPRWHFVFMLHIAACLWESVKGHKVWLIQDRRKLLSNVNVWKSACEDDVTWRAGVTWRYRHGKPNVTRCRVV